MKSSAEIKYLRGWNEPGGPWGALKVLTGQVMLGSIKYDINWILPSWRNQALDGINVKSAWVQWTYLSKQHLMSLGFLQLHWPLTLGGQGFHKQTGLLDLRGGICWKVIQIHFYFVQSEHRQTPLPRIVSFIDNWT